MPELVRDASWGRNNIRSSRIALKVFSINFLILPFTSFFLCFLFHFFSCFFRIKKHEEKNEKEMRHDKEDLKGKESKECSLKAKTSVFKTDVVGSIPIAPVSYLKR